MAFMVNVSDAFGADSHSVVGILRHLVSRKAFKFVAGLLVILSARFTFDLLELSFILVLFMLLAVAQAWQQTPSIKAKISAWRSPSSQIFSQLFKREVNTTTLPVVFGSLLFLMLCAWSMFGASELFFVLIGGGVYALRQAQQTRVPSNEQTWNVDEVGVVDKLSDKRRRAKATKNPIPSQRKKDVQPVDPVKFQSSSWEGEVEELLAQIGTTPECEKLLEGLVSAVKAALGPLISGAEVHAYAAGNPMLNMAFGMAVPELQVVVTMEHDMILSRLEAHLGSGPTKPEGKSLVKCAIRTFTDQLVCAAGFKFRRTSFGTDEPKTTLRVPPTTGLSSENLAMDLSVNGVTPFRSKTLIEECTSLDARVEPLCLLVRRWARDRGIQHVNQGHLQAYAWNLLTVFFLQVSGESVLPPIVDGFSTKEVKEQNSWKSAAMLFKDLIAFYATEFDWKNEAISVRLGHREKCSELSPGFNQEIKVGKTQDVAPEVMPVIEDPYDIERNVGSTMNHSGVQRLREELRRAHEMCSHEASLAALLDHWAPPEKENQ
mmetsp:Transcript_47774/g.104018  ORF Transcript_47774/g.104018 Transcript_47774/m.104018 type:complete len:546 (+) Transcript_47774:84-1721(+)